MNTTGRIICGALLALSASWPAGAGEIVDTYSSGDTLTATMMNNIKAAVNDNNTATRFYGDGSAGDLTLTTGTSVDWMLSAQSNLNFQNVTIESGATLLVPAGTTIRCTGNFVNNGTINVWYGSKGGRPGFTYVDFVAGSWASRQDTIADRGDTPRGASSGQVGTENTLLAGSPGDRILPTVAAGSFMSFRWGGGAGSGGWGTGSTGGGLLKVLCKGEVRNGTGGTITANGYGSAANPGSGGGGGGIVVLASQQRVINEGSIEAKGGPGGVTNTLSGAGGGGGGGIVILVAPQVTNNGTVDVSAGVAGTESTQPAKGLNPRYGGGAGGSSGGRGGRGSSLNSSGISSSAEDGFDGYVLEIQANPATMM